MHQGFRFISVALSALATSPLLAQFAPAQPVGGTTAGAMQVTAQAANPKPPVERAIDPSAKVIYDKAVAATKAAKSLVFTAELTMVSDDPKAKPMVPAGIEGKTRFTVRFEDAKAPAAAPAGGLPPMPSDSIRVERLDGPNKESLLVIHDGRVLRIDGARKTFSEGGTEHAMLAMMAMRMYPEWLPVFRESGGVNGGQAEPISITLAGAKQIDGLDCDVIKVVRQMQLGMGTIVIARDNEGDDSKKPAVAPAAQALETAPTVTATETIAIARADGLPRQQTTSLNMDARPAEADEGMVMGGGGPGPTITVLGLKVNPTIDAAVFTPKVPEGFAKAEPEMPGFIMDGGAAAPPPQLAVKVGDAAPNFNLTSLDGNQVSLASLKGKVVLLDFWATWCGPCKAAMPTMQKLHEAYKDRGVVILGVNTWEKNVDAAKDYIAKKKFNYGCLLNGDDLAKAYGVTGIPTLVIIGKDGTVAMAEIGLSDDSGASLRKAIDAALAKN